MRQLFFVVILSLCLVGCATIVNDPNIPVTVAFSDGSEGKCEFTNKRGLWNQKVPGTAMIRRSDDALKYRCKTDDGRESSGMIASETEADKFGASILLFDFGITDAITDKHRKYQSNIVIPVEQKKVDS